jgi:hypothetical protein
MQQTEHPATTGRYPEYRGYPVLQKMPGDLTPTVAGQKGIRKES